MKQAVIPATAYEHELRLLAEQAQHRSLVPFVGAGASTDAGLPGWNDLLKPLRLELGIDVDPENPSDPLDAAQWYADARGRKALLQKVCSALSGLREPGRMHLSLARLPAPVIVTTNYDHLMEEALETVQGVPTDVIVEDWHIALMDEARRTTLVKMHGCLSLPDTIVLSRDDYDCYADNHRATIAYLQSLLATRTFLFVGFGLTDLNFRLIHQEIRRALGAYRRDAYLLDARPWPKHVVDYWRQRGVRVLQFEKGKYDQVVTFLDLIAKNAGVAPSGDGATEILGRPGPPPIQVEPLVDHIHGLRRELQAVILQAQEFGLMPREEEENAVDLLAVGENGQDDAERWVRAKARALLELTTAVDRLEPVRDCRMWVALGDMLYAQGDAAGAISAYHTALRPTNRDQRANPLLLPRVRGNLARALAQGRHFARAEWFLRRCVFKRGKENPEGAVKRDNVYERMSIEHLRNRPTDASEFAYVVTRRVEDLMATRHHEEAFEAAKEARYVLGSVLGIKDYPGYQDQLFDQWDAHTEGWSRFRELRSRGMIERQRSSAPRAYALNFFGKCFKLGCLLACDLGRSDVLYYLRWAEEALRDASNVDPLLPFPYGHRMELCSDPRIPATERTRILKHVQSDLAQLADRPDARPLRKSLRDRFPALAKTPV